MSTRKSLRNTASPKEQEFSIIEAAFKEFSDVGVVRSNTDFIARNAGVSRSTLYRRFPTKEDLLAAVVSDVSKKITDSIILVTKDLPFREALVEGIVEAILQIRSNQFLNRIMNSERDVANLLFGFNTSFAGEILKSTYQLISHTLFSKGAQMPIEDLKIVSELLVRLVMSLLNSNSLQITLEDPESIRHFAKRYLSPMIW